MKQLVQDISTGKALVIDAPAPLPDPGQVLIEVAASVVSPGTERSLVSFGEKNLVSKALARPDLVRQVLAKVSRDGLINTMSAVQQQLAEPLALGYAVSGIVREVGCDVTEFKPGDRVAAAGGGYAVHAEAVVVPENLVVAIPDALDYESAAFATIGAIALQGIRLSEVALGEAVGVIGLGLLGLLTIQQLKAAGCQVFCVDPKPERAQLAGEIGATAAGTTPEEFIQFCETGTNGRGVDAVLITADTSSSAPVALAAQVARDRARVIVVGAVGLAIPRKPYFEKELIFRVSRSYGPGRYDSSYEEKGQDYPIGYVRWTERRNMEAVVALLADGRIDPRPLVTHRIPIEEGARAYDVITGRTKEPSLGVLLTYPGFGRSDRATVRRIDVSAGASSGAATGRVRVGLIGAGLFAKGVLLPVIKKDARTEFVAVCSASGKSSRLTADRFHFRYCCTDWKAITNDANVNTVVIATRHHLHAEQTTAALQAGKHVFVEKPLCVSAEELDAIGRVYRDVVARRAAPVLMVGLNRRFAPMAVALRQFMKNVAEPLAIHYRVNGGRIPLSHWTQDPAQGGGRVVGEMVHFIDWAIWMADDQPTHVYARATANGGIYNNDNVALTLRFRRGSVAQVLYLANGGRALGKERIEVHGGGKSAVLDDFGRLELAGGSSRRRERAYLKRDKGHAAGWRGFADAVANGGPSPIPFDQIEVTMRAVFATLQSIQQKREIELLP
ncbi:MAG: bi-domain-containing oxidoreductase [Acidobacteria bacterium]|nr:bi-domain-containing oxidoreductase [Acidobacteriota bacterium]